MITMVAHAFTLGKPTWVGGEHSQNVGPARRLPYCRALILGMSPILGLFPRHMIDH
jgi:hypothetical protein